MTGKEHTPDTHDYYWKADQARQHLAAEELKSLIARVSHPAEVNLAEFLSRMPGPVHEKIILNLTGLTSSDLYDMLRPELEKGTVGTSTHKYLEESILRGRRYYFWLG